MGFEVTRFYCIYFYFICVFKRYLKYRTTYNESCNINCQIIYSSSVSDLQILRAIEAMMSEIIIKIMISKINIYT